MQMTNKIVTMMHQTFLSHKLCKSLLLTMLLVLTPIMAGAKIYLLSVGISDYPAHIVKSLVVCCKYCHKIFLRYFFLILTYFRRFCNSFVPLLIDKNIILCYNKTSDLKQLI